MILRPTRLIFARLAAALLLILAAAPQAPAQPATQPEANEDPERSPDAIAKALKLTGEVAKAYQDATNLTDQINILTTVAIGTMEKIMDLRIGEGTDAQLEFNRMVFTSLGERVYVEFAMDPGHYVDMPLTGDLGMTTSKGGLFIPHFALRRAQTQTDITLAFTRMVGGGTIVGYRALKPNDDRGPRFEILTVGPDGEGSIQIDPKTKYIMRMRMEFTEPVNFLDVTLNLDPKEHRQLPEPITFDARGRAPLKRMNEFVQQIIDQGDDAPRLLYETTTGETVDLYGSGEEALVLICWAEANKVDLPRYMEAISAVETWIKENDLPVRVLAVNTLQYARDDDEQDRVTKAFWIGEGYSQTLIVDHGDILGKLFALSATPSTIIINRDHKIEKKFIGPDDRLADKIKYVLREMFDLKDGGAGENTGGGG